MLRQAIISNKGTIPAYRLFILTPALNLLSFRRSFIIKFLAMAFTLPALPYAPDALEPHIDAQTMQIHHGKHHQAYVTNLNAALEKHPELNAKSIDELCRGINSVPEDIRTAVRNNGGGHWNHSQFWKWMAPNAGSAPTGKVADGINSAFGSFDNFKTEWGKAGAGR